MHVKRDGNYWKIVIRNAFTLLILDVFIFIAVTLVNLMPSIYDRVQNTYSLASPVPIMVLESFFVIIAASLAIYWGYLIDKIDRKRILFQSMAVWIVGTVICTFATSWSLFVIGRIITAAGLGAQMPASYSIMADIIPSRFWSTLFGSLALLVSICNAAGNFISGFVAPLNIWGLDWKFAFAFLSILSVFCFFLLWMIQLPHRGATAIEDINADLGDQLRKGTLVYNFTIKREDLLPLWKIDCNRWMLYACFFAIIPGATMGAFLVYYMVNFPFASFPAAIRTQIGAIFAGMAGVGYMLGVLILGPIFDWMHSKNPWARVRYTFWGVIIAIPLLIAAFLCITTVNYADLHLVIDENDPSIDIDKYVLIVSAILEAHPQYIAYFFLLLFGGLFAAPLSINRTPVILEVNLPEHQGSSQAILNFSDQVGKGFTLLILAFQYTIFAWLKSPIYYVLLSSIFFYILPVFWWRKISHRFDPERQQKMDLLRERAKTLQKSGPTPKESKL